MVFAPYLVLKRTQFDRIKESHPAVGRWYAESVLDRFLRIKKLCP
jgi:hypothetical protein